MSRSTVLAGLMAVGALAQAQFAVSPYEYVGCVSASPAQFAVGINFVDAFTPELCQGACADSGAGLVALGDGCHCDDPRLRNKFEYRLLSEDECTTLCIPGDERAGFCGGAGDATRQVYNLYRARQQHDDPSPCGPEVVDCPYRKHKQEEVVVVDDCGPDVVDCPARKNHGEHVVVVDDCGPDVPDCAARKQHQEEVIVIEDCGPEVVNCPARKHNGEHVVVVDCGPDVVDCPARNHHKGEKVIVIEDCGPDVPDCPARKNNWNNTVPIHPIHPCTECDSHKDHTVVVCLVPEGCGHIKHGQPCPAEGCPAPAKLICLIPEGCGSIKNGEECPATGCPAGNAKVVVVVCQAPEGCGHIKHGEACPAAGCPPANQGKAKPAVHVCPPEGCIVERPANKTKPAGKQSGEKPVVIVSGAAKMSFGSAIAGVAMLALGFTLA